MDCEACRDRLPEYVAGELDAATRAAVEAALASCPSCRQELALLERMVAEARAIPAPTFDPARRANVLAEARRVAATAAQGPASMPWYRHPAFLMAAVALFAVGATVWAIQRRAEPPAPDTVSVARADAPELAQEERQPPPPSSSSIAPSSPSTQSAAAPAPSPATLEQQAAAVVPEQELRNEDGAFDPRTAEGEAQEQAPGLATRTTSTSSATGRGALAEPNEPAARPPARAAAPEAARDEARASDIAAALLGDSTVGAGGAALGGSDGDGRAAADAPADAFASSATAPSGGLAPSAAPAPAPAPSPAAPAPVAQSTVATGSSAYGRLDVAEESTLDAVATRGREERAQRGGGRTRGASASPARPAPAPAAEEPERASSGLADEIDVPSAGGSSTAVAELPAEDRDATDDYRSGVALYRAARYAEAASLLERFVGGIPSTDPRAPDALFHLGAALIELGEPSRGRAVLERLVASYPDHARAWEARGLLAEPDGATLRRDAAPAAPATLEER